MQYPEERPRQSPIEHRGAAIHKAMESRASLRRSRRSRKTRYREPRFNNRSSSRRKGRLPPSLKHRVETVMTWTKRLSRLVPVTAISVERVRFDTQLMANPEISGVQYQQGTLRGYETREYVLEKWGRSCAYCDAENVPLQLDHVRPKSRGGPSRPTDFVPACGPCNQKKGALPVETFLKKDTKRLARIVAGLKAPMRDAAAVNSTRNSLDAELRTIGVPVEAASGGRTKWNRHRFDVPKTHANDAACVGRVGGVAMLDRPTLYVRCAGRGSYCRTRVNASGFPRGYLMRSKSSHGFRTGDIVRAVVLSGKKRGTHTGRVAVRATGNFAISSPARTVDGISHRHCRIVQRADGYDYAWIEKKRAVRKADAATY